MPSDLVPPSFLLLVLPHTETPNYPSLLSKGSNKIILIPECSNRATYTLSRLQALLSFFVALVPSSWALYCCIDWLGFFTVKFQLLRAMVSNAAWAYRVRTTMSCGALGQYWVFGMNMSKHHLGMIGQWIVSDSWFLCKSPLCRLWTVELGSSLLTLPVWTRRSEIDIPGPSKVRTAYSRNIETILYDYLFPTSRDSDISLTAIAISAPNSVVTSLDIWLISPRQMWRLR